MESSKMEESQVSRIDGEEASPESPKEPSETRPTLRAQASMILMDDGERPLRSIHATLILVVVLLPSLLLVGGFSHVGLGVKVYNALSPKILDFGGKGLVFCSFMAMALYYIFGWIKWPKMVKYGSLTIPGLAMAAGCILVARSYPWTPLMTLMFLTPLSCALLRVSVCAYATRSSFYKCVFFWTLISAICLLAIWAGWILSGDKWYDKRTKSEMAEGMDNLFQAYAKLKDPLLDGKLRYLNYEADCGPNKDIARFSSEAKTDLGKSCKKALNVIFTCWVCPFIGAFFNVVLGIFALLNGVVNNLKGCDDLARLEAMLKRFLGILVFVLMGIYFSASISGASTQLGSTAMAFFFCSLTVVVITMYIEIGPENLRKHAKKSRLTKTLLQLWYSDWCRAVFIGAFNIWFPIFFVLNRIKRILEKWRGIDADSDDKFTPLARKLLNELNTWNWVSILQKICLLGELFFTLQVGVAKATYVFLSWLNGELESWEYIEVIMIIFAIGYTMFLLPPVPGVPVYVFCGIVVAKQGEASLGSNGFALGCAIACLLAWVLKLTACTGQYMIGYFAGKSLRIQTLIGVDKVITRAIEVILNKPGLNFGKVAVLIGGPDWPVSVTCGILKINIPQMLIGTAPVLFIASPCVMAGAFLGRVTAGEDSLDSALASSFIGLSGLAQMGCAFLAFAQIAKVVETEGQELAKVRPEHAAVAALSAKQAAENKVYNDVTKWKFLACWRKFIISFAAAAQLLSGFAFAMGGEYCFKPFSISSDIDAPSEEQGLDGDPMNIVRTPGRMALGLFAVGTVLHIFFAKETSRLARKRLAQTLNDPKDAPATGELVKSCSSQSTWSDAVEYVPQAEPALSESDAVKDIEQIKPAEPALSPPPAQPEL